MENKPKTREERRAEMIEHYTKWGRHPNQIQHMLDLDDRYPEVEIFGPQCISAEVGPGWKDLVEECLKVLSENGCKVGQIKQKFGGLRLYWDFPPQIEAALAGWREGGPRSYQDENGEWKSDPPAPHGDDCAAIRSAVSPVIARAESLSFRTCEDCGADIGREGKLSWKTQCESCAKL